MNKIKELRKKANKTQAQLAKFANISQQTLANYENGATEAPHETIKKFADFFNVSIDFLLGREFDCKESKTKGVKIPVLGTVPAGIPIEAIQEILDYEEITEELARTGDFFALRVKGDSMKPEIKNGDTVIVLQQNDANSGDICVVYVNGYEATVKKIRKTNEGIYLIPFNNEFETVFYSNKEKNNLPVQICGKVIEVRRSYK